MLPVGEAMHAKRETFDNAGSLAEGTLTSEAAAKHKTQLRALMN